MKIAIISPYISTSEDITFYQSQQVNLAAEMVKLGMQVDIITLKRSSDAPEAERLSQGVTIYRLPLLSRWMEKFLRQPVMKGLWRQLKKGKYDFVQSSEDFALTTLSTALYTLFNKSRLIIYQGLYAYSNKRVIKSLMFAYDLFAGPVLRYACSEAVCKTYKARQYLQRKGFQRVRVIPVGVNTSLFFPESREDTETFELLTVGNLIPLKNYSLLLDVFRQLSNMKSDVRLTIIGTGPEQTRIINYLKQYGLIDRVEIIKKVPNKKLQHYYSRANIFLLFSKIEIFGMVMLEAMACGCPVVATPLPGVLDVISKGVNGFIVDEDSPGHIAHHINSILDDRIHFVNVREEAIKTATERYSWPVIAKQYRDLYFEHING
jgi:glycosyltransferase involved in cell wall biosynthesis